MSRTLLFTILTSIVAHAAVALYEEPEEFQNTLAMGSVKAPVSLTFSTVSTPTPPPVVEPVKELPKPVEKKPKPVVKKKPIKKDVVKIAKPKPEPVVEKKPEPEKPKPVVEKKPEQKKAPQPVEQQVVKSAIEETEVEGVSDEPIFIEKPAIRSANPPRYPRVAQRRNMQGVVMLEVIVDIKGNAMNIKILESSGYKILDKSAIAAVEDWKFEPQKRNNRLIASRVHIPVAFQLN